eukprot:gnl/TRDRNA2_/TRDRNA2_192664_c0_seq1.p1 gnl/TRDRNA2_/TRDRNA2_192664_c0~~gnl/TRDRNA2_/TRDRNA2_192664_c0_seq1.p1  ORF type:complete len:173 (+),score=47.98 gnl/TRDRNA2_/TRDRNA2_192664_c0_seq1:86-604(+)
MLLNGARIMARRAAIGSVAAGALGAATAGNADGLRQPAPVRCDGMPKMPDLSSINLPTNMAELAPIGGGISVGTVFGFTAGFALKKVGKAAAFIFGSIFALQQTLAYFDYVSMNWPKIEKDMMMILDTNKDGKIDDKDFSVYYLQVLKVLQGNQMPCAGGFTAGFLYGVKKG